jgi:hypothetical protein
LNLTVIFYRGTFPDGYLSQQRTPGSTPRKKQINARKNLPFSLLNAITIKLYFFSGREIQAVTGKKKLKLKFIKIQQIACWNKKGGQNDRPLRYNYS